MKKLISLLLPAIGIFSLIGNVQAQFVSTGPYGGALHLFYRENSNLLAAGSGGVYQSSNEGRTWQELATAPNVFGCDVIHSVASSAGTIYAGSRQSGIFRSVDGGASWSYANNGLSLSAGAPYTDIEIAGPHALAIRADSGYLFFTSNQGINWSRINFTISNAFAQYLSLHNNDVFVSTPQGLFKSSNGGINFTNVNPLAADFGKPYWVNDTLYVATSTGVKMSVDEGASFTNVALAGRAVRSVAVSGSNMYAVVRNPAPVHDSVLYSNNAGSSFTAAPFNSSNFRFTVVHDLMATAGGALVGSDYGVYGSANSGSSWGRSDSGYTATSIRGLAVSGAYVLAGAAPMGVYRVKPDSGALDWQHTGDMSQNVDGRIQCLSAKGAFVHAGSAVGYFRSADSGATWTVGATGANGGNVTSLFAKPGTSDVWMVRNGNLHYSSDDGTTFGQVVNSNIPPGVAQNVFMADTATFVATFGTLYKGGSTMSFSVVSGLVGYVSGVVHIGNTFYAATIGSGLYSSPNGSNWSPVSISPPNSLPEKINVLITDGTNLIAGTDDGVFTDNGGNWTSVGLAGRSVQSLVLRNGKLFVGTCSGVFSIPYKIIVEPNTVPTSRHAPKGLDIWPNPSTGDVTIAFNAPAGGATQMVVHDLTGKALLRQNAVAKGGENHLKLSAAALHLVPGVYFVQLSGSGFTATGRLLIQ